MSEFPRVTSTSVTLPGSTSIAVRRQPTSNGFVNSCCCGTWIALATAPTQPAAPRGIVRSVANRYIAGETVDDALRIVAGLNERGFRTTLDILGEHIHNLDQARRAAAGYVGVLDAIDGRKLDGNISIKLTQLGLKVDLATCFDLTKRLVEHACELKNFVRIDMEDSSCTTDTLQI